MQDPVGNKHTPSSIGQEKSVEVEEDPVPSLTVKGNNILNKGTVVIIMGIG